jgi:hypothetical protein
MINDTAGMGQGNVYHPTYLKFGKDLSCKMRDTELSLSDLLPAFFK